MRTLITFIIFLVGQNLLGQTIIDSLKEITTLPYIPRNEPRIRDTINCNIYNLLPKDTLIISSYIADCGEFGGHKERISFYIVDKKLQAVHSSDPICDPTSFGYSKILDTTFAKKNKYFVSKPIVLTEDKTELVRLYIINFNKFRRDGSLESTASTDFWIKFKHKTIVRHDKLGEWDGFIKLRNELYK